MIGGISSDSVLDAVSWHFSYYGAYDIPWLFLVFTVDKPAYVRNNDRKIDNFKEVRFISVWVITYSLPKQEIVNDVGCPLQVHLK